MDCATARRKTNGQRSKARPTGTTSRYQWVPACTLSDGRIAVAGGVNKDIFLEALRNQAPDYLQHPAEWYRFNPNVFIYDPDTESWSIEETTAEAARAGASIVAGQDCDLYLLGGEIKPRIRTAETLYINEIRRH